MFIYIYIYIYIYVCMYIFMYMYICMSKCINISIYRIHTYMYMDKSIVIHLYVFTWYVEDSTKSFKADRFICIHIHLCIHTYIYIHIYVCIHIIPVEVSSNTFKTDQWICINALFEYPKMHVYTYIYALKKNLSKIPARRSGLIGLCLKSLSNWSKGINCIQKYINTHIYICIYIHIYICEYA